MSLVGFDPLIAEWFERRFGKPTEPQVQGWPEIRSGRDVLISAPTGSGKTLAAFLICLDDLVRRARHESLPDETSVVYVSPLKALSNDVQKNLEAPLAEIYALAAEKGILLSPIRTAVRTGDTKAWERQRMAARPPHVLVTTPESLYILLTAESGRRGLSHARTVIVDEIHAVADDKRGSHLALSLARLEALVSKNHSDNGCRALQRIGLSATVKPMEEVARFLSNEFANGNGRVISVGHRREMELAVEVPKDELGPVATMEMWGEIYDRLAELIRGHRTTLVFVNTRRLAERVAHQLGERLGEDMVLPHHGSLARQLRHSAEQRLKDGQLRAVVATASLELGIDIGTVDLVCQLGSPRSIAVALQRVGRSGHWVGAMPKGRLFATTRDELIECAALVRAIRRGELDRLEIPAAPLDILAQQIVAMAACDEYTEEELFTLVRSSYPYRQLSRKEFDAVLETLSEGVATSRGRSAAYLHHDRVNGRIRGRRGARLAAITSGGAIPETAQYQVVAEPEGTVVGTLDEDFAVESMVGDIFLLATTSWRIRRVEAGRVRVEDAHGAAPTIPFWRGEAPGRTVELSAEISSLRESIVSQSNGALSNASPGHIAPSTSGGDAASAQEFLMRECGLDCAGAEQAVAYVRAGAAALGALPANTTVVAERFFDEAGGMQLVIHAPFGARINRAWGLSLRKKFCRSFNLELQAAATDNGIVISLTEQHAFPLELVFEFLKPATLERVLTQALLASPMFAARWRWNVSRALAVLRFSGGKKVPPPIQRMRSDDLMAAVFPDQAACAENLTGEIRIPDHPFVNETIANCLHEAMDLNGLRVIIEGIQEGRIKIVAVETAEPSPFCHEILNANPYAFLDDAPLEERRTRAVQMRRSLGFDAADGPGALDPDAIAQVAAEAWPVVRDADELHDALLTLVMLPPVSEWEWFFDTLRRDRRATVMHVGGRAFWVSAERLALARKAYPEGKHVSEIEETPGGRPVPESREGSVAEILRGWLDSSGPVTASELIHRLALGAGVVDVGLAQLESEGQVLRGQFSGTGAQTSSANGASPEKNWGQSARAEQGPWISQDAVAGACDSPPIFSEHQAAKEPQWCNRRLLARIHRLTLGRLRREIEPVSSADFMRFLLRWQHAAPNSRLHGFDGTLEVIKQLQGYEIPAAAWESHILPRRVANYKPEYLDRLCLSGEIAWGRLSPHPAFEIETAPTLGDDGDGNGDRTRRVRPTRVAPMTFFLRDDAEWLLACAGGEPDAVNKASLSHPAREVLAAIESRGASFFNDLTRTSKCLASEVEGALWELVAAGLVTADGFENLRSLLDPKRRRGEGRGRTARPRHAAGRWALLREAVGVGQDEEDAASPTEANGDSLEAFARQLLARWGVVFRDIARRESLAPPWRDLLGVFRRMEARGEIRGGRFAQAFIGEQFALPEAVELLRSVRRSEPTGEEVVLAAADPLNLVGVILPGTRVGSSARETVHLRDGVVAEEESVSMVAALAGAQGR